MFPNHNFHAMIMAQHAARGSFPPGMVPLPTGVPPPQLPPRMPHLPHGIPPPSSSAPHHNVPSPQPPSIPPSISDKKGVQWTQHTTDDGRVYYYNEVTKQSSWEKPDELKTDLEKKLSVCPWKEYKDQSGKIYYHNVVTKESSWTIPQELEQLKKQVLEEEALKQQGDNSSSQISPDSATSSSFPTLNEESNSRSGVVTPSGATNSPGLEGVPMPSSQQDLKEIFNELLREKNVSSSASWEYALKLIGSDSRYELFRHHPERKQMFNNYKIQKSKEEREEQRAKIRICRENLEKMLQTSDKINSNTRYSQACQLFATNEAWKSVPEQERREIFREVIEELSIREKELQRQTRKRNMSVLAEILDAMPSVTFNTRWEEAQQLLLDNPVFAEDAGLLGMDKEDALIVFEEHIRALEKEEEDERRRQKSQIYRQQRKNREAFIQLLDQLHKQGKLTSISKWCHLYPEISTDPRFTAMLTQPLSGSTALDLFKFYVEDLRNRYEDDKEIIRDILKKKEFEVGLNTTYEEFVEVLSQDDRSEKVDAGNVKMIFERLIAKVNEKEKERIREENRKRKKMENAFMNLLHSLEPAVDETSNWEQVKKAIQDDEAFLTVPTEEERYEIFKMYIQTVQESCSHHHSRSTKKKSKDKKDKRLEDDPLDQRRRRLSSSPSVSSYSDVDRGAGDVQDRDISRRKRRHRERSVASRSPVPEKRRDRKEKDRYNEPTALRSRSRSQSSGSYGEVGSPLNQRGRRRSKTRRSHSRHDSLEDSRDSHRRMPPHLQTASRSSSSSSHHHSRRNQRIGNEGVLPESEEILLPSIPEPGEPTTASSLSLRRDNGNDDGSEQQRQQQPDLQREITRKTGQHHHHHKMEEREEGEVGGGESEANEGESGTEGDIEELERLKKSLLEQLAAANANQ